MKLTGNTCLKILFLGIFSFVINDLATAQNEISYSYDGNGNRLTRTITIKKSNIVNDSLYQDEITKEIFNEEIGNTQIRIYPNPVRGDLEVDVTGLPIESQVGYSVYSTSGTMLKTQKLPEHHQTIDFSNYPSGVYILKLDLGGETSKWKIIKE